VPVAAVLAIDSSGSMVGDPIDRLKEASVELVTTLTGQGIPVGLLQFDTVAERLSDPTTDTAVLVSAIEPIQATDVRRCTTRSSKASGCSRDSQAPVP
jgi:Mg-chelatase subunit ChlD